MRDGGADKHDHAVKYLLGLGNGQELTGQEISQLEAHRRTTKPMTIERAASIAGALFKAKRGRVRRPLRGA